MSEPSSERRLAENQVVFRENNEKVQKGIDKANAIAAEEGAEPLSLGADTLLYFNCECSDENCRKRIKVTLTDYNRIHSKRNRFVIACGHDVPKIEDVTEKEAEYCVVTKHETPPQSADRLNSTDIRNV
jgi:hypothetical protein